MASANSTSLGGGRRGRDELEQFLNRGRIVEMETDEASLEAGGFFQSRYRQRRCVCEEEGVRGGDLSQSRQRFDLERFDFRHGFENEPRTGGDREIRAHVDADQERLA